MNSDGSSMQRSATCPFKVNNRGESRKLNSRYRKYLDALSREYRTSFGVTKNGVLFPYFVVLASMYRSEPFSSKDLMSKPADGPTVVAFVLWNRALGELSATEAGLINNAMLPQIAILAWIFLDEALGACVFR